MFLIVCTKHCKDLIPTDRIVSKDGGLAAVMFDQDDVEASGTSSDFPYKPYEFDLSGFVCPDNTIDETMARAVQGSPEEYQRALEEADCAPYYCVVDADTMYPLEDFIETRAYHVNWAIKHG